MEKKYYLKKYYLKKYYLKKYRKNPPKNLPKNLQNCMKSTQLRLLQVQVQVHRQKCGNRAPKIGQKRAGNSEPGGEKIKKQLTTNV